MTNIRTKMCRKYLLERPKIFKEIFLRRGYFLTATVVLSFQILLIIGIGKCSAFAPDEESYLQIFEVLYLNSSSSILNYAGTSSWIYRIFFFPGLLLAKVGIEPIYSIRGSAIFYSQVIFALCWNYIKLIPKTFKPPIFLVPVGLSVSSLVFLSHGLKESFIFLILALYFTSLELLQKNKLFTGGGILLISLVLIANLKLYLYVLIIASTILSVIFLKNRVRVKMICTVVVLSFLSVLITPSAGLDSAKNLVDKGGLRFVVGDLKLFKFDSGQIFKNDNFGESVTLAAFRKCQKNNSVGFLEPFIMGVLPLGKVSADQSGKVSASNFYAIDKPRELIVLGDLPFNLINFSLGPIPGTSGGVSYFGLLDTVLWLYFFLFMMLTLFDKTRLRLVFDEITVFAISFFFTFTLFSAAIEVNSGTSFRHRTVLFIPLLIILSRMRLQNSSTNPPKLATFPDSPGNYNQ